MPVIESYGMTEAAHQMTTNLLPPYQRKEGSVGMPVGLEVKIVDSNFNTLQANQTGEVVIKGKNVISKFSKHKHSISIQTFKKLIQTISTYLFSYSFLWFSYVFAAPHALHLVLLPRC